MEVEGPLHIATATNPLDLTDLGERIENDVSDNSDYEEISDQDTHGGYTYGLQGSMVSGVL